MIKIQNFDKLKKQLDKNILEMKSGLTGLVKYAVTDLVEEAVNETPLGDYEEYQSLYDARLDDAFFKRLGIRNQIGFARGSWQVSMRGRPQLQHNYGEGSGQAAVDQAEAVLSKLKLQKSHRVFQVLNYGPYIESMNSPQAPQGVFLPVKDWIESYMNTNSSLKGYYLQGKLDVSNS